MNRYLKKHCGSLMTAIVFSTIYSAVYVGVSVLLQRMIDLSILGNIKSAFILAAGYAIIVAIVCGLQVVSKVKLNQDLIRDIRSDIVTKILNKDTLEYEKHKESDYVSLVQNDVKKIEDSYIETIINIVINALMMILSIILLTRYSWVFTAIMFVMTGLMFVIPTLVSKMLSKATIEHSKAQEVMTEGLTEVVSGYEVAKSFQKEDYTISKFEKCNSFLLKKAKKFSLLTQMNNSISLVLILVMQSVICIMAGFFIYKGKLSVGSMAGVIQLSSTITQPIFQLFALIPALKALEPIWKKIEDYTKASETKIYEPVQSCRWNKITFEDASFAYPDDPKTVLSGINLELERGQKYLIIGESGAGKSTLINMICGNYAPKAGRILIDGKSVSGAGEALRRVTAVVWQKVFLFNESIKDNILMGSSDADKLKDALKEARIDDMVSEKGLDYKVGSDGNLLSGGQKQRIAIARALFADRDIIVLDEGISALDSNTATEIEDALLSREGQTLISISHHISPEMRARYDRVIMLKDGTIEYA